MDFIIDFHTHIFQQDICGNRDSCLDDEQFRYLYKDARAKLIDHTVLLESMKDSGLTHAVAMGFPWIKKEYALEQNRYFSTINKISQGTILPFGTVPLEAKDDIDTWVREIKEMGLFGIGETAFYLDGMNETNYEYLENLLKGARKYSLPLCLHVNEPVGHLYPGKYDPSFSRLYPLVAAYPDVTIIFSHWGGGLPFYELMPEVSKAFKNFYYDTAASPYLYDDTVYTAAANIIGTKKILFGSDFPLLPFERYKKPIEENIQDKEAQKGILGNNAARLLGLTE
ncbi:MAG: amidohydrolase family protein [bacterium]|nr:amidohydrolase family protein [bacterium]